MLVQLAKYVCRNKTAPVKLVIVLVQLYSRVHMWHSFVTSDPSKPVVSCGLSCSLFNFVTRHMYIR